MDMNRLPPFDFNKIMRPMKWITREKIKVDRVACPWLIRNFVDREAEFVFLPHGTDWSQIGDAIVYDALYAECLRQVNLS